jgi:signal transduction histidine kinase
MVAHELRTPLTGLRGFTDLLRMRSDGQDPRRERLMGLVVQQVDRLSDLVNELLSLANIEQQRLTLHYEATDLVARLVDVVERFRLMYPQRTILFERRIDHCHGLWDAKRLDQVLSNLIENALKYSPAEFPVEIAIDCINAGTGHGEHVVAIVKDQGIGIAPEDQARLFGKFFRASNAEAYQNGLGLGLYISNEIVRQHGGTISVESAQGMGSTFTLMLPVTDVVSAHDARESEPQATPVLGSTPEH